MKPRTTTLLFLATALGAFAQMREWKATTGQTITAEFVKTDGTSVTLKTEAGRELPVKLVDLAEESRELAKKLAEQKRRMLTPAQKAATIERENYVPHKNEVAGIFEGRIFDVVFYSPSGSANVFVKENGKYLSEPIRLSLALSYINESAPKGTQKSTALEIQSVERCTYDRGVFRIVCKRDKNVTSEIWASVKDGELKMSYRAEDPEKVLSANGENSHRLALYFPPSYLGVLDENTHAYTYYSPRVAASGVDFAIVKKLVEPWQVLFKPVAKAEGVPSTLKYSDSIGKFYSSVNGFAISGGAYGPRRVNVAAVGSSAIMNVWLYPGKTLADGFRAVLYKKNFATPAEAPSAFLQISVQ